MSNRQRCESCDATDPGPYVRLWPAPEAPIWCLPCYEENHKLPATIDPVVAARDHRGIFVTYPPQGYKFMDEMPPMRCKWFAMCENAASFMREHPTLGQVPCCARCLERTS
jgi:hypothetical protein